ncbi:hypothetical protein HY970_00480 [Candidatus Kaiserbacteria bacterium]|nr:hypothetical protein [Candidatus Kaiserbacteria bacterium]
MSIFAHLEDTCGWRPRHPIVCYIDVAGLSIQALLMMLCRPHLVTAVLPIALAMQYTLSCVHHWMPYSDTRSKLDRAMIFVLIGASFVPYWGGLLPTEEALVRLPLVGAGVFLGCVLVCCEVSDKIIGASWALFAGIGLLVSGSELSEWLPPEGLTAFWIGVCCYAAQQVVYSIGRPDPLPGVFGFRESQHAFLLAATTTHSAVALTCT